MVRKWDSITEFMLKRSKRIFMVTDPTKYVLIARMLGGTYKTFKVFF